MNLYLCQLPEDCSTALARGDIWEDGMELVLDLEIAGWIVVDRNLEAMVKAPVRGVADLAW